MENFSEKTKTILYIVGVANINKTLRGMDASDIYWYLCERIFGHREITQSDIEKAAEEIAEALKQKEQ